MHGIALIGQGRMGQAHAQAWAGLGLENNIRYVCTPRPGPPLAHASKAQFVTDLDQVLEDESVDIVSVCTPTPTHAAIAIQALAAGKNVLLEKPIALTVTDAQAVAEAATNSTGTFMVAHVVRFFRDYQALRTMVDAGRTGQPRFVTASRLSAVSRGGSWLDDEALSGGPLVDFAIHDFDQLNLFLGTPIAVTAKEVGDFGRVETSVKYAGGGVGLVETCSQMPRGHGFENSLQVVGTRGTESLRFLGEFSEDTPYRRQAEYFLECIESGTPPSLCPTEDAILALRVALAAQESLQLGTTVDLGTTG